MTVVAVAFTGWALTPGFSANFLTKSVAKQLFFTKKKADVRFYTKAQSDDRYYSRTESDDRFYTKAQSDDRYYTKSQSDSRYLSADGATVLQASPVDWQEISGASPAVVQYDAAGISLLSGVAGNTAIAIAPTVPAELAGRQQKLLGVAACYDTVNATTVTQARINVVENTTGSPSTTSPLVDSTVRTDAACRDYMLNTPVTLDSTHDVVFGFSVSFAGGGSNTFFAGRTTFLLAP